MLDFYPNIIIPLKKIRKEINKVNKNTQSTDIKTDCTENEVVLNDKNKKNNNIKIEINNFKSENNMFNKKDKKLLTEKPIYNIPIDFIIENKKFAEKFTKKDIEYNFEIKNPNIKNEKKEKIKNSNIYNKIPIYSIPINLILKETEESKIKTNQNNENNNFIKDHEKIIIPKNCKLNKNSDLNIDSNINNRINNDLFSNKNINSNQIPCLNGPLGINHYNSIQLKNLLNKYYYDCLMKIIDEKIQFMNLKNVGLNAINNPQNINHYLLNNLNNYKINEIKYK